MRWHDAPQEPIEERKVGSGLLFLLLLPTPEDPRTHDSDRTPSDTQWSENDNDEENNEHFHTDEQDYEMDPLGVITEFVNESLQTMEEKFEDSLHKVEKDLYSQIAARCNFQEYEKRIDKTVNKVDTKLSGMWTILNSDASDIKILQDQAAAASQVVTPPTTPRKETKIRPVALPVAPAPKRVATPLAQQVLKRNVAKRKEQSGSEAMDVDKDDSTPVVTTNEGAMTTISHTQSNAL
ncbi:hypothetical protein BDD12DRAFT_889331 [Trichophaea hybrida]|nr:hypothetical protein BDD12DRAFT_889331 [Trichophaea hybrida]